MPDIDTMQYDSPEGTASLPSVVDTSSDDDGPSDMEGSTHLSESGRPTDQAASAESMSSTSATDRLQPDRENNTPSELMVYRYIISINVIPWRVNVVANTNFTIPSGYRHVEFLNERPSDMALFYRKLTEVIIDRVGCDRTYADGQSEEVSLGADGQSEEVSPDAGNQSKEVSSDFETTAGQQSLQLSLHPIEFCFSGDMVYLPQK